MTTDAVEANDLLSSVEAGRKYGFTNDYITRLAREQKIEGRQSGRQWFVDPSSLEKFLEESERSKKEFAQKVRESRKKEREQYVKNGMVVESLEVGVAGPAPNSTLRAVTLSKAGLVLALGVAVGGLIYAGVPTLSASATQQAGIFSIFEDIAARIYNFGRGTVPVQVDDDLNTVEKSSESPPVRTQKAENGMVVYPESGAVAAEDVERSFSDEVRVTPDTDGGGGIIEPTFKSGEGETYRYLIVPVDAP